MQRNRIGTLFAAGVLSAGTVLAATPAVATDAGALGGLKAPTVLGTEAETVLDNVAVVGSMTAGDNVIEQSINGVDVEVPVDPSSPIKLDEVGVVLPSNASEGTGQAEGGVVEFDGTEGADTVVVAKNDGSVQIATIINNAAAPTSYSYELSVPSDITWAETTGGAWIATDAEGALVLGVAPAWATDADENPVSTRYELRDSLLTQVVYHRAADVAYPVVADPWLGAAIFQRTSWQPSVPKAVGVIAGWGAAIQTGVAQGGGPGAWLAGQTILKEAGWSEFRDKVPAVNNKPTYKQQFDCHVLGAYNPVTGGTSWDLEGFRSNRPNWINGAAYHRCNW